MNKVVSQLADEVGPACGIAPLIALEIISCVISILVNCWRFHKDSAKTTASDWLSEHYDPVMATFDHEVLTPVRRHVRSTGHNLDAWQELLLAQEILKKARIQSNCTACLESLE